MNPTKKEWDTPESSHKPRPRLTIYDDLRKKYGAIVIPPLLLLQLTIECDLDTPTPHPPVKKGKK